MTPEEFHEYLIGLAMEAFDRIRPLDSTRFAFGAAIRERMAQAATVYAADTNPVAPKSLAHITLQPGLKDQRGRWHIRVHLCPHHYWSGWHDSYAEALQEAWRLADEATCTCDIARGIR